MQGVLRYGQVANRWSRDAVVVPGAAGCYHEL